MGENQNVNPFDTDGLGCRLGAQTDEKVDKMVTAVMNLEEKVSDIDKRTAISQESTRALEKANDRLENLYNRTICAIEKSAETFVEVQTTMVKMQEEIKNLGRSTDDVRDDTRSLKVEVEELKKNFNNAEELGKVDMRKILQSRMVWLLGGGFVSILITLCGTLFTIMINFNGIINFIVNLVKPYIK